MRPRFSIRYHYAVEEYDIPRLSREWRVRVKSVIEARLTIHPDIFGKPLRYPLAGARKLRIGDYRVAFTVSGTSVIVWAIGHRQSA